MSLPQALASTQAVAGTESDFNSNTSALATNTAEPVLNPFLVTTTLDSSPGLTVGSLRQAILDADANPGANTIAFNIPVFTSFGIETTIFLASPLPPLTDPVTIDGFTQPGTQPNTLTVGNNALLMIVLDGTNTGPAADGLTIDASGCTVEGLVIDSFSGNGIVINSSGNTIEGDYIGGISSGGTLTDTNGGSGILISAPGNTIGGTTPASGNIIAGNQGGGIDISATGNLVQGNLIGTNAAGTASVGNRFYGVAIDIPGNTIGGTAARCRQPHLGKRERWDRCRRQSGCDPVAWFRNGQPCGGQPHWHRRHRD